MRCPDPNYVWPKGRVIAVPCGKCLACLSNKRQDWSHRLLQEMKVSDSAVFVTLTYSEKYYPEQFGLVKRHLQLYLKRLRKKCPRLRYYAVGEYGSRTGRAHYHGIFFNANESAIRECWTLFNKVKNKVEPIGIVHVGTCTEASIQYVTKYIIQKGSAVDGLNPPFSIMSRAYGLGLNYLSDAMLKWHREGDRIYMVVHGEKVRLPRFYKEKIWPASEWSDWLYRRETVFKNARKEAEQKEERENKLLKQEGFKDPDALRADSRNAVISRIKSKVAFSQKF